MSHLADYGLVPVSEALASDPGLAHAARGIPIYRKDGTIRAFTMVEVGDHDALAQRRWYRGRDGYVYRNLSHRTEGHGHVAMHRELLGLDRGDPRQVDHINRHRLDNRRVNLRTVAGVAEQLQNVPSRRGAISGHRGVSRTSPALVARGGKPWRARAQQDRRQITIGHYDTEDEAAEAAAAWRAEHMPFSDEGGSK